MRVSLARCLLQLIRPLLDTGRPPARGTRGMAAIAVSLQGSSSLRVDGFTGQLVATRGFRASHNVLQSLGLRAGIGHRKGLAQAKAK